MIVIALLYNFLLCLLLMGAIILPFAVAGFIVKVLWKFGASIKASRRYRTRMTTTTITPDQMIGRGTRL